MSDQFQRSQDTQKIVEELRKIRQGVYSIASFIILALMWQLYPDVIVAQRDWLIVILWAGLLIAALKA